MTVGASDFAASIAFYPMLGLRPTVSSRDEFARFELGKAAICMAASVAVLLLPGCERDDRQPPRAKPATAANSRSVGFDDCTVSGTTDKVGGNLTVRPQQQMAKHPT